MWGEGGRREGVASRLVIAIALGLVAGLVGVAVLATAGVLLLVGLANAIVRFSSRTNRGLASSSSVWWCWRELAFDPDDSQTDWRESARRRWTSMSSNTPSNARFGGRPRRRGRATLRRGDSTRPGHPKSQLTEAAYLRASRRRRRRDVRCTAQDDLATGARRRSSRLGGHAPWIRWARQRWRVSSPPGRLCRRKRISC